MALYNAAFTPSAPQRTRGETEEIQSTVCEPRTPAVYSHNSVAFVPFLNYPQVSEQGDKAEHWHFSRTQWKTFSDVWQASLVERTAVSWLQLSPPNTAFLCWLQSTRTQHLLQTKTLGEAHECFLAANKKDEVSLTAEKHLRSHKKWWPPLVRKLKSTVYGTLCTSDVSFTPLSVTQLTMHGSYLVNSSWRLFGSDE